MKILKCRISNIKRIDLNSYKVILKPLLTTYASYLANFLRHVIFTSVLGCAITEVKIDGVISEFDKLPGISGNITDLILNLKGIIFKLRKNSVVINLNKIGDSLIKASDFNINKWVKIINPEHVITHLYKNFTLNITIKIERGVGYHFINNDNYKKKKVIGGILLDANYSPINKIYYKIKKIKNHSNLNYIEFFIETNGSVSIKKVIFNSIGLLVYQLSKFKLNDKNILIYKGRKIVDFDKKFLINVSNICFDSEILKYMNKNNINYLGDLTKYSKKSLLKIFESNYVYLKTTVLILKKYGLNLNTKIKNWKYEKKKYIEINN